MAANAPAAAAPPVATACPNSFTYENPVCVNNGTLHIGDRVADELSCSYCDCEEGWEGVDCGRCSTVSACPDITLNGTVRGCKKKYISSSSTSSFGRKTITFCF